MGSLFICIQKMMGHSVGISGLKLQSNITMVQQWYQIETSEKTAKKPQKTKYENLTEMTSNKQKIAEK